MSDRVEGMKACRTKVPSTVHKTLQSIPQCIPVEQREIHTSTTMDYRARTGELDRKRAHRAIPNIWRVGMPLMQSGLRAAPEV